MRSIIPSCLAITPFFSLLAGSLIADSPQETVTPLIAASCVGCHDADSETGLDLTGAGYELNDPKTFKRWEKVFDRLSTGDMPPPTEERPDPDQTRAALAWLKDNLYKTNLERQQQVGRVPARRLTKTELGHTLRDLLSIDGDLTSDVPDEVESGSFDTVGSYQRISSLHLESYLKTADVALDRALTLRRNPYASNVSNLAWLDEWHNKALNLGGGITRKLDDGIALFADVDYLTRFQFNVKTPGIHRITSKVAAIQSQEPVTAKLILREPSGGATLLKSVDLEPGKDETIVVDAFLKPGDTPYLTIHTGRTIVEDFTAIGVTGGSKFYRGAGIAIKMQKVEGPISDNWPPTGTRNILKELDLQVRPNGRTEIRDWDSSGQQVSEILRPVLERAFRRPLEAGELDSYVALAAPLLKDREPLATIKVPLRAALSSPQFLTFDGEPGALSDYALASRLSYFIWKSLPDQELWDLAEQGKLQDTEELARQVDRMLDDDRSERFVNDFLDQWLRLAKINATTPDEKLYPEYDELLGAALPLEPRLFFAELIRENRSALNLVDSDFTYVNRRLAEHYRIDGIRGQDFRRVTLPAESPRGGVLTMAAVLKTTANGTVTSPVTRGNFVLTNFLGTPPSPPPPSVGSIEPDIRGKTTIREILAAHRDVESCAKCHREIDPPGFALESFDPIGGFRKRYRSTGGGILGFLTQKSYRYGPLVDPSGKTADGEAFDGMEQFKQLLLKDKDQVARNFVSQLVVYSTGGEIEFADREVIEEIIERTKPQDFPVRDIIHAIVQSRLFRHL